MQICDLRDGWNSWARQMLVGQTLYAKLTFQHKKAYTDGKGFLVGKVPPVLWDKIRDVHNNLTEEDFVTGTLQACIFCELVKWRKLLPLQRCWCSRA